MSTTRRTTYLKMTSLLIVFSVGIFIFFSFSMGMRVKRYLHGVKPGVTLEGVLMEKMLLGEVRERVETMAARIDRAPQNARLGSEPEQYIPEIAGLKVNVTATVEAVMAAQAGSAVHLSLMRLDPEITVDLYESIDTKIASFSTSGGGSAGRTDNLYMAAKYMNGHIMAPGDVFSFNGVTGPRTIERGYSMAPVVGGMGIGGGVCQVATTIYNTALEAGLEIIERHPHSIQVGYVRPGRDATVTNYIDFKFRNSTDQYIQIRSGAGGGHVWVQLWSQ